MPSSNLIDALILTLEQEISLLEQLNDQEYSAPGEGHYKSSIGMHLRHNLDHFVALFDGLESGRIDYESRQRNELLQESTDFASDTIHGFITKLNALRHTDDRTLQVREEDGRPLDSCNWLQSTLSRELQFLMGHTVHHHAIIALMLNAQKLPAGFGVAPSTQRHEERTASK
ncbi:hypothetical protein [Coraliomargarita akajimensis]|uniref:DinB family protein n=1 Tax=Coraliomargarita akajimensis (strain DSM 45221 / IAM 15411 / JCM 23193 / KCTC 12865 / 04OKA010-24) TaxID=583355 RepID=D5EKN7_CORAD|nr:hypothetical protein [Coraliomargarita akajimensis]ADE54944.1 conserved hypothetical protein [Coraliomargarita akajimensis DSM 45221]